MSYCKKWTEEETLLIKSLYANTHTKDLSKQFNCSRSAILRKAKKHNLKSNLVSTGNLRYSFNKNYFEIPTTENSYWAGFIAADGYISNPKKGKGSPTLRIHLHEKDIILLERFKNCLSYNGPILKYKTKTTPSVLLCIICKKLCLDLNKNFPIKNIKNVYNLSFYCSTAQSIADKLNEVSVLKLDRKWNKLKDFENGKRKTI